MRFSEYMNDWLYGNEGYYTKFIEIGKEGDFYTAVSSSMFFGGSIANRLIKVIQEGYLSHNTLVVEIGAHQGYMLADMVQFIYTLKPELLDSLRFGIVEPQKENYLRQVKYFKESFGDVVKLEHFKGVDEVEENEAFIVANEIFDAFSCEVVKDGKMLYMDKNRAYFDTQSPEIKKICQTRGINSGEIGIGYGAFAKTLASAFKKYEFVTFDYGDLTRRDDMSLRIYHKHKSYPFFAFTKFVTVEKERVTETSLDELFKNSDITYDVDFGYLIDEFEKNGAKCLWLKTQLAALVEFGITDLLEMLAKNSDEQTYQRELDRAKVLINPTFMGERFKCVIFRK